jgi:hypothetical protein
MDWEIGIGMNWAEAWAGWRRAELEAATKSALAVGKGADPGRGAAGWAF